MHKLGSCLLKLNNGVRLRACQGVEGSPLLSGPPLPPCSSGSASCVAGRGPGSRQLQGRRKGSPRTPGGRLVRAGGCGEPAAVTTGLRACTPGTAWREAEQAQLGCTPGGKGRPSPLAWKYWARPRWLVLIDRVHVGLGRCTVRASRAKQSGGRKVHPLPR